MLRQQMPIRCIALDLEQSAHFGLEVVVVSNADFRSRDSAQLGVNVA
jgi:hypothetical protein